jgi:hypothetical protein
MGFRKKTRTGNSPIFAFSPPTIDKAAISAGKTAEIAKNSAKSVIFLQKKQTKTKKVFFRDSLRAFQ